MIRVIAITFLGIIFLCCSDPTNKQNIPSHSKEDVISHYLISVDDAWDSINSGRHNLRIIQVSTQEDFEKAHIPGATKLWRPDYSATESSYKGMAADKDQIANLLSRSGINSNTLLFLYDRKGNVDAFRFAWVLELYGFTNFKIINGGLQAWTLADYPIRSGPNDTIKASETNLLKIDSSGLAGFQEVQQALYDDDYIIIDTREPYEFNAEPFVYKNNIHSFKPGAFGRGRIPQSIHLNWSELIDLNNDHRLKSLRDIHYDLERKNIQPGKKIIVYCQSGSRSAHTYFILRHVLNYPYVKNYDGSWIEWSYLNRNNPDLFPVELNCDEVCFSKKLAFLKDEKPMKYIGNGE